MRLRPVFVAILVLLSLFGVELVGLESSFGAVPLTAFVPQSASFSSFSLSPLNFSDVEITYLLTNHLGSVVVEADTGGRETARRSYFPYGEENTTGAIKQEGSKRNTLGFTAKESDNATGLYYFGVRYYEPGQGRWVSVDPPPGDLEQWSQFSYVDGEPVNQVDTDGRQGSLAKILGLFDPTIGDKELRAVEFMIKFMGVPLGNFLIEDSKDQSAAPPQSSSPSPDPKPSRYPENFESPVRGPGRLGSPFGLRVHPITKKKTKHEGIDIAAPVGTPVVAIEKGIVVASIDRKKGFGKLIIVEHVGQDPHDGNSQGFKLLSYYAHLSKINVKTGDRVEKDQKIGEVGSTGFSTGPHLHFAIKTKGRFVNPEKYIVRR